MVINHAQGIFFLTPIKLALVKNILYESKSKDRFIVSNTYPADWTLSYFTFLTDNVAIWTGEYWAFSRDIQAHGTLDIFLKILDFLLLGLQRVRNHFQIFKFAVDTIYSPYGPNFFPSGCLFLFPDRHRSNFSEKIIFVYI